jgi:membrane protease YdiL (CAAX protease family)
LSGVERGRATAGLAFFAALSCLGSWFVAAALRVLGFTPEPTALGTRLLTTSLLYALTMGWQPIVAIWAVRRWIDPSDGLDLGLRPTHLAVSGGAGLGAIALAAAAAIVAWIAALLGILDEASLHGAAEPQLSSAALSMGARAGLVAAFFATILVIWIQAFAEEVGWRGYFLPRAMARFGRWRGLVLHGVVWGMWYAPVLFFASHGRLDPLSSMTRSLGFMLTCVLLGILYGGLRLASRSVAPVVVANTALTLAAGLPYVLHGIDGGMRAAMFEPPGWLVLAMSIACLACTRWRDAIRLPARADALPRSGMLARVRVVVVGPSRSKDRPVLH